MNFLSFRNFNHIKKKYSCLIYTCVNSFFGQNDFISQNCTVIYSFNYFLRHLNSTEYHIIV